jgi:N-acetylglucosamine kinase-like BadF-type ATPase
MCGACHHNAMLFRQRQYRLYLCVDCGGSKTSAVICNYSGKVLGRALSGPSNFSHNSPDEFLKTVLEAINGALKVYLPKQQKDCRDAFYAAWFGISGVDSPTAVKSARDAISSIIDMDESRLRVANDTHLLAAPLNLHSDVSYAVVCIAGTGSICVSFDDEIEELGRIGGWGWMLGDEGGGFYVGREAIRQLMRIRDLESLLSPPSSSSSSPWSSQTTFVTHGSALKARVLKYFGVTNILDILRLVHLPDEPSSEKNHPTESMPREKRISSLSPLVFASAFEDGDPLALAILRTSAGILASQISLLLRAPTPDSDPSTSPPPDDDELDPSGRRMRTVPAHDSVLCFGGSLVGVEAYREMVLEDLARIGHKFPHVEYISDAAEVGARGLCS